MKLPVISGIIDRRMLVNDRVDPDVMAKRLPRGRIFLGVRSHGRFESRATDSTIQFSMQSDDGGRNAGLAAKIASTRPS